MSHKRTSRDPEFALLYDLDPLFEEWRTFAAEWLELSPAYKQKRQSALYMFFEDYLHKLKLDKNPRFLFLDSSDVPSFWAALDLDSSTKDTASTMNDHVFDFVDWVLKEKLLKQQSGADHTTLLRNPFSRVRRHRKERTVLIGNVKKKFDPEYRFLIDIDPELEDWRQLAAEWAITASKYHQRRLTLFFTVYLPKVKIGKKPEALLDINFHAPSLWNTLELDAVCKSHAYSTHGVISDFVTWVLKEKFSSLNAEGNYVICDHLHNPFPRIRERRSALQYRRHFAKLDKEFNFLLKLDPAFDEWRKLAVEWLSLAGCKTHRSPDGALARFFVCYLHERNFDKNPKAFLSSDFNAPPLSIIFESDPPTEHNARIINDHVYDFLEWVLREKFSCLDGDGYRPLCQYK